MHSSLSCISQTGLRDFLTLVADLPRLLFTVLGVAVFFRFLGSSFHFQLTDLLGFEMTVLFLDRKRKDVGELLAVSVNIGLAHLNLDLSRNVVTVLCRFP